MYNKKERMIRFSIQVPVELYEAALSEAKDQAVSISAVVRWALKERYQRQLAQVREQETQTESRGFATFPTG